MRSCRLEFVDELDGSCSLGRLSSLLRWLAFFLIKTRATGFRLYRLLGGEEAVDRSDSSIVSAVKVLKSPDQGTN